jgi:hypothetical protein
MLNRFTSLVAVVGLSLAGAACQSTGTDWLGQNRSDEFNSPQNASYQSMPNNQSVQDQQNAHVSGHDPLAGSSNNSSSPDSSNLNNSSSDGINSGSSASENQ